MGWFKELLMRLYLIDRPVGVRKKDDRRQGERRWEGQPNAQGRRRKDRRKDQRRG